MSKTKLWITLILAAIALVLISWNMADIKDKSAEKSVNNQVPTYQGEHIVSVVYNPIGKLSYKIMAEDVKYYTTGDISWFTQLVVILFDKDALKTWSVRANCAKLTKNRVLYLYGHVEVESLTATSQVEKIKTDNAKVDLITQDVSSDEAVTLYGINFTSKGMKMRGNLRAKTADLTDKVKTIYDIHNQKNTL